MGTGLLASNTQALSDGVAAFVEIASSMLTTVTSNPTLMVFFCSGLAFTAVALVKSLKSS